MHTIYKIYLSLHPTDDLSISRDETKSVQLCSSQDDHSLSKTMFITSSAAFLFQDFIGHSLTATNHRITAVYEIQAF